MKPSESITQGIRNWVDDHLHKPQIDKKTQKNALRSDQPADEQFAQSQSAQSALAG
jgi:hypothetical protein